MFMRGAKLKEIIMKKILLLLLSLLFLTSNANAVTREATNYYQGETDFEKIVATGGAVTGNPGYLGLVSADYSGQNYTYYLWVDATGSLRMASHPTISLYSQFPNGDFRLPTFDAGTVIGTGTGSGASGFTDDGTQIRLTTSTDKVGIGTTTPNYKFEVVQDGTNMFRLYDSTDDRELDIQADTTLGAINYKAKPSGTAMIFQPSALSVSSPTLYLGSDRNVGIGTFSPTGALDVRRDEVRIWTGTGTDSNAASAGELYVQGDLEVDGTLYGDGSGLTNLGASGWTDGGANVYTTATTDNVGIGTTTPSTTLEIVRQSTRAPFMISTVATGDGDIFIINSSGNVGIATINPSTNLEVGGSIGLSGTNDLKIGATSGISFDPLNQAVTNPKVSILSSGNVGIGTTTAPSQLTVAGVVELTLGGVKFPDGTSQVTATVGAGGWTDGGTNVYLSTTTDTVGIGTITPAASTTVEIVKQGSNAPLRISSSATGNGDYFVMESGGNVGIGTATQTNVVFGVKASAVGTGMRVYSGIDATKLDFIMESTLAAGHIKGGTGTNLLFTVNAQGAANPAMFISQGRNIGIGTSNPTAQLDVKKINGIPVFNVSSTVNASGDYLTVTSTGNVGIGTSLPQNRFVVFPPAVETITAAATITANACGTTKRINAASSVTTNTTNTFTAVVSGYDGCCMRVINVDDTDAITLDHNAAFFSNGTTDVVLGPGDTAEVCADVPTAAWYQEGSTGNN